MHITKPQGQIYQYNRRQTGCTDRPIVKLHRARKKRANFAVTTLLTVSLRYVWFPVSR